MLNLLWGVKFRLNTNWKSSRSCPNWNSIGVGGFGAWAFKELEKRKIKKKTARVQDELVFFIGLNLREIEIIQFLLFL